MVKLTANEIKCISLLTFGRQSNETRSAMAVMFFAAISTRTKTRN